MGEWAFFVTGSELCAAKMVKEEIDGSSLLMLEHDEFRNQMDIKMGPLKKLQVALALLKSEE